MKKTGMAFCIALAAASASATDYTWTGSANTSSWKDPGNWSPSSGYPSQNADVAIFNTSVTVILDTGGIVAIDSIKLTRGTLTLNASNGTVLDFHRTTGAAVDHEGWSIAAGSEIVCNVPVVSSTRVDKWGMGLLTMNNVYTNTSTSYPLILNGTNVWAGNSEITLPNGEFVIGSAGATAGLVLKDNAKVDAKSIRLKINGSNHSPMYLTQQDNAEVVSHGNIALGNDTYNAGTNTYTVAGGKLDISGQIWMGLGGSTGKFVQSGGETTVNGSIMSTNTANSLELSGGRLYVNYSIYKTTSPTFDIWHSGGTLAFSTARNSEFLADLHLMPGTPEIDVPTTRAVSLPSSTDWRTGTQLTKKGAGELRVISDQQTDGSLVVEGGYFNIGNSDGKTAVEIKAKLNDHSAWPVTVKSGGIFQLYNILSRCTRPLDLKIESGGKLRFPSSTPYNRSILVAHSLTIHGETKAKGRYTAGTLGSSIFEGLAPSSIVVPYVWTGNGDGASWSDANNWDGGVVPPSGSDTCVDLSRAGGKTIVLDNTTTLGCIVANPNGFEKTVTISGAGKIIHSVTGYSCGIFVGPDRTLVLDVPLQRNDGDKGAIIGGGTLVVKKSFPCIDNSNRPRYSLDGTVVFAGEGVTFTKGDAGGNNYSQMGFYTHENEGHSKVVFPDGCSVTTFRAIPSSDGFYPTDEYVQDGGTVVMRDMIFSRYNGTARSPFSYTLNGGVLDFTQSVEGLAGRGIFLGDHITAGSGDKEVSDSKKWARYPDGNFVMNGGILRTTALHSQCHNNYYRLYGGDIYLGSGGFARTTNNTKIQQPSTNSWPVQLGGVKIHATANFQVSAPMDMMLTGMNGDTVFDTAGNVIGVYANISGVGGLVKSGASWLYLRGTNTFTGPVTVNAGYLRIDNNGLLDGPTDFTVKDGASLHIYKAPETQIESLVLANANQLDIAAGLDIQVSRYVVGGVLQSAGTYTPVADHGTVTVVDNSASVWQGGSAGGAWSTAANWTGDVPNSTDSSVDFGYSALAVSATINVDTAVSLKSLTYRRSGSDETLILTGNGSLSFSDKGTINVPAGHTLVINVPINLGGYLYKTGEGKLVVNGAVTSPGDKDAYFLEQRGGEMEVNGEVSKCRLWVGDNKRLTLPRCVIGASAFVSNTVAVTAGWGNSRGEIVQNGGIVDENPTTAGFSGSGYCAITHNGDTSLGKYTLNNGEFRAWRPLFRLANDSAAGVFLQNGGVFTARTLQLGNVNANSSYTLAGGEMSISTIAGPGTLNLDGGKMTILETAGIQSSLNTVLGGNVELCVPSPTASRIASPLSGSGAIRKTGAGSLALLGVTSFTGTLTCDAGTLSVENVNNVTEFAANGGVVKIASGALPLNNSAVVKISGEGSLALDFSGEATVRELWIDGTQVAKGRYGATTGRAYANRFSGSGVLVVTEGEARGTVVILQ